LVDPLERQESFMLSKSDMTRETSAMGKRFRIPAPRLGPTEVGRGPDKPETVQLRPARRSPTEVGRGPVETGERAGLAAGIQQAPT
jgi:hypothetical protein